MEKCELIDTCGFFLKHQGSNELACQGFINIYCEGLMMDKCKRKEYLEEHGVRPPDDMMPSGRMLDE